ncbi:cell division protein YceG [Candidatus Williamhamiltonella defendens]|nr:endolytic transglycosylase MltG [Candidatus Hamiltonella defensa]AYB49222.1 cell division protein YceG [Candidatus Hamiltonella defensa]
MKKIYFRACAFFIPICLLISLYVYYEIQHFAHSPLPITKDTILTVPPGTGRIALETILLKNHLLVKTWLLRCLLIIEPQLAEFKAGTYYLLSGMSVKEMLELFASGKEAQFAIRFIEGTHWHLWKNEMDKKDNIKHLLQNKTNAEVAQLFKLQSEGHIEGAFYPDTYFYSFGNSDLLILKRAHQKMNETVNQIWEQRNQSLPYKTPDELVTMASIIEKETSINAERKIIASVFINRLRLGMRLQSDPTVMYGLGKNYTEAITHKDLLTVTPYNTYIIPGLPPAPITMPGLASLNAAAHPEETDYLYFVANGEGGHTFSTNLTGHNRAVRAYREALKKKNER